MKTKRYFLKKALNKKYCGGTRFDFLDDDERLLIYKAMQQFKEHCINEKIEQMAKCFHVFENITVVKDKCTICGKIKLRNIHK